MHKTPIHVRSSTNVSAPLSAGEAVVQADEPVRADEARKGSTETLIEGESSEEDLELWRDRALRLQAEMENYRKRQQRLAEEQVLADRERVMRAFLDVADDLARALNAHEADPVSLRQGVAITYRNLKQALDREGVQAIDAEGRPFDPAWHKAVGVVPHQEAGVRPQTVVEVLDEGYRLDKRVLRPARVIVAV
jgi:molecular chaperone GrpE